MSSLTWLDFSDAERKRALQVVELLGRPETRDELGLGAIRDTFSNALFPGMSTVQRRARYFLFVPWTFREAERRWAGRLDVLEPTRRREPSRFISDKSVPTGKPVVMTMYRAKGMSSPGSSFSALTRLRSHAVRSFAGPNWPRT
jgi:hypothetical protein